MLFHKIYLNHWTPTEKDSYDSVFIRKDFARSLLREYDFFIIENSKIAILKNRIPLGIAALDEPNFHLRYTIEKYLGNIP